MAEVEAQPIRRDERPRLLYVRTEHLAQRPVQHMGRGVIAADAVAADAVDRGRDGVAFGDAPLPQDRVVHDHAGSPVARIGHLEFARRGNDRAGIADLAAGLGVERRAVEHDLDPVTVTRQRDDGCFRSVFVATGELGWLYSRDVERGACIRRGRDRGACAFALRRH
jgi:hypothetical protein